MDLFECGGCSRRYVAASGTSTGGRPCRVCGGELALVVRSIPGRHGQIAAALNADRLDESEVLGGELLEAPEGEP